MSSKIQLHILAYISYHICESYTINNTISIITNIIDNINY